MTDATVNMTASDHRKGLILTAIGGTLFTFDVPLARLAMTDQWTLIFVRGIFLALAIVIFWLAFRRINGARLPFINGWAGIIVAITNTLANIMFLSAVTKTTAANLVFILALNPIFCAILAWIFLSERVHRWTWVAVVTSVFGVCIIVWGGLSTGTYVGDLLAVGVALCTAIALTVIRKTGKNVVTSLAVGSLVSAGIALFWGAQPSGLAPEGWGWLALNGLLVIPLASGLIALGPRYLPAPEVAMFFLLDVVLTPVWVWLIFDEIPTTQALIGGAIVFTTLFVHGVWRYLSSKQVSEEELFVSGVR
ncbi:MAG: DMT family transporter [Rhizobiales bacterium]|nr:DMT family transporter [Hyphomicrobiales bacterium]